MSRELSEAEKAFAAEVKGNVEGLGRDPVMKDLTAQWFRRSTDHKYSYNFRWMGRPLIQYPQDMVALQEIVWDTQPDIILETGIAHGGSLIYSASLLRLLGGDHRKVIGIDIEIRPHNRKAIEEHPMAPMIEMIEGSALDQAVVDQATALIPEGARVMVLLDSNHTHDHVLGELRLYAPLVTPGCYCVVYDTVVEDLPAEFSDDRPWGPGDNPKTAVHAYLKETDAFQIDHALEDKIQITVAPDGWLKRVR
ncbi:cephalosporin hydroxylase family protein [Caenispirillum salinarum]|uniref:cephalosporin hydroxylase family protein n=1 Tax=Caenispirillum salinarum TaxID=859058 RepID=UPI00384B1288